MGTSYLEGLYCSMQGLVLNKRFFSSPVTLHSAVKSSTVKSSKQGKFPDQFKTDSLVFGSYGKRNLASNYGKQPRAMTITCIVSGVSVATLTNNYQ